MSSLAFDLASDLGGDAIVFVSPGPEDMPPVFSEATSQEIVIEIAHATGATITMVFVTAVFVDGSPSEVVYRAGSFQVGYSASAQTPLSGGVLLRVRRDAGWPAAASTGAQAFGLVVDVLDDISSSATAQQLWVMPTLTPDVEVPLVVAAEGARDLFALTRELIVWQLRE